MVGEVQGEMAKFLHAAIVAPERDPKFAESKFHGELVQREVARRVSTFCKRRRVAIDVGAHIGLWTKELIHLFDEVWAFEPSEENFVCLKANVPKKACLVNAALGDYDGKCDVVLEGGNSGMWRVTPGDSIEMHTLDSYFMDEVDLIKIDAEGYEGKVIKGAIETIRESRPAVLFEDNGLGIKYYGAGWSDPKLWLGAEKYAPLKRFNKDELWLPT